MGWRLGFEIPAVAARFRSDGLWDAVGNRDLKIAPTEPGPPKDGSGPESRSDARCDVPLSVSGREAIIPFRSRGMTIRRW